MKGIFLIVIFSAIAVRIFAQHREDSLYQETGSGSEKRDVYTLQQTLPQLPDSILSRFHRIDSICNDFKEATDIIRAKYQKAVSKIDNETNKVNKSIDSLRLLSLTTDTYTKRLDSIKRFRLNIGTEFASELNDLKTKATGKLNAIDLPSEYKEPIQQLTKKIDALDLTNNIHELNIPGYTAPKIGELHNLNSKAKELAYIGNLGQLPPVKTPLSNLPAVSQSSAYLGEVNNITSGDLEDISETIEAQATRVEGMGELQKQTGIVNEYKGKLDILKDPGTPNEKLIAVVKEAAIDHFAGKQEQLKAAMEKISKYKQKYSSVSRIFPNVCPIQ